MLSIMATELYSAHLHYLGTGFFNPGGGVMGGAGGLSVGGGGLFSNTPQSQAGASGNLFNMGGTAGGGLGLGGANTGLGGLGGASGNLFQSPISSSGIITSNETPNSLKNL